MASSAIDSEQSSAAITPAYNSDLQVEIAVNQAGFLPRAHKRCVVLDNVATRFRVVQVDTGRAIYQGSLISSGKDLGEYNVGDFSAIHEPGIYYIQAGTLRSYPFQIRNGVYDSSMRNIVSYFSKQRCGPSTTGYLSPCHADDGIRRDNGTHQDVTGGWHDASDLRKLAGATIYGMIGLSHLAEALTPAWGEGTVMEELRWGNRFFLKIQEPAGYVMNFYGGTETKHDDTNRWTDNIAGNEDDRVFNTDPADFMGQYSFVIAQARMSRLTLKEDSDYAQLCRSAAERCLEWCLRNGSEVTPGWRSTSEAGESMIWSSEKGPEPTAGELGALVEAAVELYKTTHKNQYIDLAVASARQLLKRQVTDPLSPLIPIQGFFLNSATTPRPYRSISHASYHLIGLCDLLEILPSHSESQEWKAAIQRYSQEYLARIMERNSFGIAPFGFYGEKDPGGGRQVGQYWYRYFMFPVEWPKGWWVGINANLASAGVGLIKAARVLQAPKLVDHAQRQLDWIIGANPFCASTIEGVGYNQPGRYVNPHEFRPATPRLAGAVMNGLGGNAEDQPARYDGQWQVSEYWTPMAGLTLWLMAELDKEWNKRL